MEEIFNIGIVGAGVVAERMINASGEHGRANVRGIYDINKEKLAKVSDKYNLGSYNSFEELLADDGLDIIYLAVPPKHHYPLALEIFKTGKHFLCEKPLANSTKEAREMAQLANEKGVVYGMNFPTIYRNGYKKIVELLENDFVGEVSRIEFQGYFRVWPRVWQQNPWVGSREQGGFTREVVTHYIQLMQSLFGELESVTSFITYPEDKNLSEDSLIAKSNIGEIEVLINCISDIGMKEDLSFNIIGDKGVISLKNWNEVWISKGDENPRELKLDEADRSVGLLDNFFKRIDGEEAEIVDFSEGYKVHKVVEELLGNE